MRRTRILAIGICAAWALAGVASPPQPPILALWHPPLVYPRRAEWHPPLLYDAFAYWAPPLVYPKGRRPRRGIASLAGELADQAAVKGPAHWNVGAGFATGFSYDFAFLAVQRRLGQKWSLDVEGLYSDGTSSGSPVGVWGVYLMASYYFQPTVFSGFQLQGGLGYFTIHVTDPNGPTSATSAALPLVFGWRGRLWHALSVYGGAGGQIVAELTGDPSRVDFSGILPLLIVQLSVAF
jgi:hypothetical protein